MDQGGPTYIILHYSSWTGNPSLKWLNHTTTFINLTLHPYFKLRLSGLCNLKLQFSCEGIRISVSVTYFRTFLFCVQNCGICLMVYTKWRHDNSLLRRQKAGSKTFSYTAEYFNTWTPLSSLCISANYMIRPRQNKEKVKKWPPLRFGSVRNNLSFHLRAC